jgi:hypothetical protein
MFAPVTSCDVERSFSKFKDILTSQRSSFIAENLEKYVGQRNIKHIFFFLFSSFAYV